MTSRSSCERPSTHPYHDKRHQSQTSLQSMERWRTLFSWIIGTYKMEDLPPLPEGVCLSSSSLPLTLPALPCTSFDLPPPFQRMTSPSSVYDTSWAQAIQTTPLPLTTVISLPGMQGYTLHQPQPHSILATSGIISSFYTVPTSQQEAAPLITEPLPPNQPTIPVSSTGTNPSSRSGSLHQSRNQSPDPLADLHGKRLSKKLTSSSSLLPTSSLKDREWQQSEEVGSLSQMTQILPQSYSPRQNTSMGSMEKVLSPLSQRSNLRQLLEPLTMTLPNAIRLFREVDMAQPPSVLLHAAYDDLFSYFAYELLASPVWASTPARMEYFYFSERKIPCDNILQGEAS